MIMFPFILVVGVLLLCKMGSETTSAKAHNRAVASWKTAHSDWVIRATSDRIEEQHEYHLKTAADYRHIRSEADRICPCIPDEQRNTTNYLRVFLSQRGKIPRIDTISGIDTPLYPSSMPTITRRAKRIAFNDYMCWLDAELRKHGMQERMLFEPLSKATSRRYYELFEVDALGTTAGRFIWVPQSIHYHLDNAK